MLYACTELLSETLYATPKTMTKRIAVIENEAIIICNGCKENVRFLVVRAFLTVFFLAILILSGKMSIFVKGKSFVLIKSKQICL